MEDLIEHILNGDILSLHPNDFNNATRSLYIMAVMLDRKSEPLDFQEVRITQ